MRIPRCRLSELWPAFRNGAENLTCLADMVASSEVPYGEWLMQDQNSSLGSQRSALLKDYGYGFLSDSKPHFSIVNGKMTTEDTASSTTWTSLRQLPWQSQLILSFVFPGFSGHSALRFATFCTSYSFAACLGEDDSFTPRTSNVSDLEVADKRTKDLFKEAPTVGALVDGQNSGVVDVSTVKLSSGLKSIHPTAIVHPDAVISEDVIIGPFCTIGRGVKLGRGCFLHPSSHIHGNTELGEKCTLYTGAVVGSDLPGCTVIGKENSFGHYAVVGLKCQDLKYKEGDDCNLYIGQNNDIREYVSIHRSSKSSDQTVIGNQNLIMGSCHIAHDCKLGNHNILANGTLLGGHVIVQDHVHSGGAVAVHQFCQIDSYSFLAGGSMVCRDVPMYMMVAGDRAELRGLNLEGLRRNGFSNEEVRSIRRAYQKLFMNTDPDAGSLEDRLTMLESSEELMRVPAVVLMLNSVKSCFGEKRRGICKYRH